MEYNISCEMPITAKITINFSNNITYIINFNQLIKLINGNIRWKFNTLESDYHYYYGNNRKIISLLEFLFDDYQNTNMYVVFKNKNKFDFTDENILIYHYKHSDIIKEYNVIKYFPGFIPINGKESGFMKNPVWEINDNENIYYLMYCEKDKIIKLCDIGLKKIQQYEKNNDEKLIFYYGSKYNQCLASSKKYKKIQLRNLIMDRIDNYSDNIHYKNNDIYDFRINNLNIINNSIKENNINDKVSENIDNPFSNTENYIKSLYTEQIIYLKNKYNNIKLYSWSNSHIKRNGTNVTNPIWRIKNNNEKFYLMYCGKDIFTKLCKKSLDRIRDFESKYNNKHITFYVCSNNYIQSNTINNINKKLYMHQIIMGLYGQGQGTMGYSVDHINRDVTDNTYSNLRIACRKEQETNKKVRKKTKLPEGFISENLPMYVEYHTEKLPSGNIRDCFRISKIPNSKKKFVTSKSMKLSVLDKYRQVIEKYKEIYGEDMLKDLVYPENYIK
jgi:hypothetical protein